MFGYTGKCIHGYLNNNKLAVQIRYLYIKYTQGIGLAFVFTLLVIFASTWHLKSTNFHIFSFLFHIARFILLLETTVPITGIPPTFRVIAVKDRLRLWLKFKFIVQIILCRVYFEHSFTCNMLKNKIMNKGHITASTNGIVNIYVYFGIIIIFCYIYIQYLYFFM